MENETKGNELDNWNGFLGSNWLNVDDVKTEKDVFVCIKVELDAENQRPMLVLEKDKRSHKLSLNVTNANFVKDAGVDSPKDLIGKKFFFRKTMAFSPSAKKDVQALRIAKVE
jgi:hypothetical protein